LTTKKAVKSKHIKTISAVHPRKPKVLAVEVIHPEKLALVLEAHPEQIQELLQHKDVPRTFFEKLFSWDWND
jgi:hypothetical protein